MESPRCHLVLFATQGPPLDDGIDLRRAVEEATGVASGRYASIEVFSPALLRQRGSRWDEILTDMTPWLDTVDPDRELGRQWAATGFFRWKPELLASLLTSDQFAEGSTLVYHDVDVLRYPEYLDNIANLPRFVDMLLGDKQGILFRDSWRPLTFDVKSWSLSRHLPKGYWGRCHVWAGALVLRVGPEARALVEMWRELASDIHDLGPWPNGVRMRGFQQHSADQAMLSIAWYQGEMTGLTRAFTLKDLRGRRRIPPSPWFSSGSLRYLLRRSVSSARRAGRVMDG